MVRGGDRLKRKKKRNGVTGGAQTRGGPLGGVHPDERMGDQGRKKQEKKEKKKEK